MHHEGEVGLVEAHAQGRGGDQGLDPVGLEVLLQVLALGGVGLAGVGRHLQARLTQVLGDLPGRGDGQAVDDAAARHVLEVGGQPGQAGGGVGQDAYPQVQGVPLEAAAQHQDAWTGRVATREGATGCASGGGAVAARGTGSLLPGCASGCGGATGCRGGWGGVLDPARGGGMVGCGGCLAGRGGLQLLGDVGRHPGVGGGRGGQDRGAGRQGGQQGADTPVVGAEVVAPVRDAVRLVDHHEPGPGGQVG